MSVEFSTVGLNDNGATLEVWKMDLGALVLLASCVRAASSSKQPRKFCALILFFILSTVFFHEMGHAVTFLNYGCRKAHVSVRLGWGFAYCVDMDPRKRPKKASEETDSSLDDGDSQAYEKYIDGDAAGWWISANGTFVALLYLLVFCGVLFTVGKKLGQEAVHPAWPTYFYDFGTFWALVWYPVISVIFQWGDFVSIYKFLDYPVQGVFFCVVQVGFLCGHSFVRRPVQNAWKEFRKGGSGGEISGENGGNGGGEAPTSSV